MRPRLHSIGAVFSRIASLTFGSGNTTTMLLRDEIVERRSWIGEAQFALCFTLARVTPGTNLLAFCAGAGYAIRGFVGALTALLSVGVPSAVIAVLLTLAYARWHGHPVGAAAISGAMSSIIGVIGGGAWLIVRPYVRQRQSVRTLVLVFGALVCAIAGLSPLQTMALAALVGYFWRT